MKTLYIFDSLEGIGGVGDGEAKHLLSEATPLTEKILSGYDCWHCAIDTQEYLSEIGLLYALAAKLGKKLVLEETRALTPEYWRDLCRNVPGPEGPAGG